MNAFHVVMQLNQSYYLQDFALMGVNLRNLFVTVDDVKMRPKRK